jgi:hypothetical protein
MGFGTNVVLKKFITTWYVSAGNSMLSLDVPYPAKIYAGLFIRLNYISVSAADSRLSINYLLHKVLI